MRFFCDQLVDVAVARMLREQGHDAWTASGAGLAASADDDLTVYTTDQDAVLVTHDREFSNRRSHNVVGRHIQLRCNEWDAAELLRSRLPDILPMLERYKDLFVLVSVSQLHYSFEWR